MSGHYILALHRCQQHLDSILEADPPIIQEAYFPYDTANIPELGIIDDSMSLCEDCTDIAKNYTDMSGHCATGDDMRCSLCGTYLHFDYKFSWVYDQINLANKTIYPYPKSVEPETLHFFNLGLLHLLNTEKDIALIEKFVEVAQNHINIYLESLKAGHQ